MTTIAALSGALGAAAFAVLLVLLRSLSRQNPVGRALVLACMASAGWLGLQAVSYRFAADASALPGVLFAAELLRDLAWLGFFARLLATVSDAGFRHGVRLGVRVLGLATVAGMALALAAAPLAALFGLDAEVLGKLFFCIVLLVALGTLVLIEQVFRNTARDSRWALKHLCVGVGLLYIYDFYLYADAALFNRIDPVLWSSRGAINALVTPMIAISAARNRRWDLSIFVSRHVVFHAVVLIAAGAYLMVIAAAGYYIQAVGGEWGRALTAAFLAAATLLFLALIFSTQLRSRLKLFVARHFYRNKYEYGQEWLNFTQALARTTLEPDSLHQTILGVVCDLVDSPGGVLWYRTASGSFAVAATVGMYEGLHQELDSTNPFVAALLAEPRLWDMQDEAAIESSELRAAPRVLVDMPRLALVVPIVHGEEVLALLAIAEARSGQPYDWEDLNLLGTVARQAASYLALLRASDALSEARQFETFNRLSAFLVHDLKNVVAQLSLIVTNARRHGHNPEFIADAFTTVGDAVTKMNRMLASLRQRQAEVVSADAVDLVALLEQAVASREGARPCPRFLSPAGPVAVRAAREPLLSVVQHLLQNAIEATAPEGRVTVSVEVRDAQVHTLIADTGCGMDRDFIHHRLFKPFDTTKGKAGMGIGAYESRHLIASMHGELRVESEPGVGTTFTIVLPGVDAGAGDELRGTARH